MNNWFVYIIENKLKHYYTGISKDIERRFAEHQSSGKKCAKALKGKGPLMLKYCCQVADHSTALKMEFWLKSLSKTQKERFIKDNLHCEISHNRLSPNDFDVGCL